jgi:(S)-citramalyl-CoA lyase
MTLSTTSSLRVRRSLLFVPGLRPDRYAKAMAVGADCVCVDLEDAVAPDRKDEARHLSLPVFGEAGVGRAERVLRINGVRTIDGLRDILALSTTANPPDALMLPKIRNAEEVRWLDDVLSHVPVTFQVIIETNDGLLNAAEIAQASPRITTLLFGAFDMAAELRASRSWDSLLYARSQVVHAAARAGEDVMDVPFLDLQDQAGLKLEASRAVDLGFTGKAAIHPDQLAIIHSAFSPGDEQVKAARRIMDAFAESTDGLLVVDGKLIERPVIRAMERILALHEAVSAVSC